VEDDDDDLAAGLPTPYCSRRVVAFLSTAVLPATIAVNLSRVARQGQQPASQIGEADSTPPCQILAASSTTIGHIPNFILVFDLIGWEKSLGHQVRIHIGRIYMLSEHPALCPVATTQPFKAFLSLGCSLLLSFWRGCKNTPVCQLDN